jgi:outer membrane protein
MKLKFTIPALLVFFLFMGIHTSQAQKNAYVDSALILSQMQEVKQAEATLETLQKKLQSQGQAKVEAFQKRLEKIQDEIAQGLLTPKQQEEESNKFQAEQDAIAKFEQDMVSKIKNKRSELLEPIYDKLNAAIKQVAKENSIDMVFDKATVLFGLEALDLTLKVKAKLGL